MVLLARYARSAAISSSLCMYLTANTKRSSCMIINEEKRFEKQLTTIYKATNNVSDVFACDHVSLKCESVTR